MEVRAELEATQMWRQGDQKIREVIALDSGKLQQWVRASFLSDSTATPALKAFVNSVVKPALQCNVSSIPAQMQDVLVKFTAILAGGAADDQDIAQIKIASAAITGDLTRHPLICGLALQCKRQVEKQSRGLENMSGRRSKESEYERALICDAGLSLAICGANTSLAREFGLPGHALKVDLVELAKHSLPQPALALSFPDIMDENFNLADQRYLREDGVPKRALG